MYPWILGVGVVFALYNAWGIGANDCANSFATSVGAKVLTLRQAVVIAAIFEFGGAVLMGSHVTDTVRKKIVEISIFENNPGALMFGMLCADLSSAIWLTIATYFKYPVSTTHSIIGAIVGFSLAYGGADMIVWREIGLIVLSWLLSPLIAGIFSYLIFTLLNKFVFNSTNPYKKTLTLFPILTFITFFINSLFIIYKGSPQLKLDEMPFWKCFLISLGISLGTAFAAQILYIPYIKQKIKKKHDIQEIEELQENTEPQHSNNNNENPTPLQESEFNEDILGIRTTSYSNAIQLEYQKPENTITNTNENSNANNKDFKYDDTKDIQENIKLSKTYCKSLELQYKEESIEKLHENAHEIDKDSEDLCSWIQIITACFSSFAHGSNDVANAIAPLATIYHIYQYSSIADKQNVPIWVLAIGGFGIVIGLATWGYKIIDRIGRELTKITPSRGFIIELSAALTVIIASRAEIPVSTTHCQVGSVLGCGLGGGTKNIKWDLVKGILFSWLITLPFTGLLSAALFSFGYYAPNKLSAFDIDSSNLTNTTNITNTINFTNFTI